MNGAEIVEKFKGMYISYETLAKMIDNAIAEATKKEGEKWIKILATSCAGHRAEALHECGVSCMGVKEVDDALAAAKQQVLKLTTDLKYERENPVFTGRVDRWQAAAGRARTELLEAQQQILELDAVIARISELFDLVNTAGFYTHPIYPAIDNLNAFMVSLKPSESLRQYTEQIKEEVREKCFKVCDETEGEYLQDNLDIPDCEKYAIGAGVCANKIMELKL